MAKYIPEQHFKGIRENANGEIPLAFITPYGIDKPAKQRMKTVEAWSGGKGCTAVINNIPLTGFKISREIRRWSTSNVVWRIEDPRGFELEISSGNMAYLLAECIFNKGVIEDELIWCRDGSQNYLLPTNSDEYSDYNLFTKCIKSGLKLKDINIGDHIQLSSGESGMYLGGYNMIQKDKGYYNFILENKRRYILLTDEGDYILKSSLKDIQLIKYGTEGTYNIIIPNVYVSKKKHNIEKLLKTFTVISSDSKIKDGDVFEYKSKYYKYMGTSYYTYKQINLMLDKNCYSESHVDYYTKSGLSDILNQERIHGLNVIKKKFYITIDGKSFEIKF